jgi:hypothetical protein
MVAIVNKLDDNKADISFLVGQVLLDKPQVNVQKLMVEKSYWAWHFF